MTPSPEQSTHQFWLCAKDPSGRFLRIRWSAAIVPRVGDQLWLPDTEPGDERAPGGQEISVTEVMLYPGGDVEVWSDGFTGWEDGSVEQLFGIAERFAEETGLFPPNVV